MSEGWIYGWQRVCRNFGFQKGKEVGHERIFMDMMQTLSFDFGRSCKGFGKRGVSLICMLLILERVGTTPCYQLPGKFTAVYIIAESTDVSSRMSCVGCRNVW